MPRVIPLRQTLLGRIFHPNPVNAKPDNQNLSLAIKELGGTGHTHDWSLSRRIREDISIPLFLAGGLNQANVAEAIAAVEPFGLDLCSSVRTNDHLDPAKLRAFFAAIPNEAA